MKKSNHTEVMEVEAEEMLPEIPLEKVIETTLVKANITEQVIAKLQETYGGMKLKSLEDKEGYLEIKEARKSVRKVGIITEDLCKKGRERAVKEQRLWLAKQNEILGKIAKVQDPLDAEIKKFDDEVERKETEEKIKREEAFIARQSSLLKYGAEYKSGNYELGEISYETELIKQADTEVWEEVILPKFKRVYEQKEAARVEEENKRKAEFELQKKQREEFEQQQAAFKLQQEEFAKQQKALQEQKDKQEREIREAEQKKQHEELQKRFAIRNGRVSELKSLGCTYDAGDEEYSFKELFVVSGAEVESLSEKEWVGLVNKTKPLIEKLIADEKEILRAQIEKQKQEAAELAAKREREKIAEEQRLAQIKKAEEMAQASDKEKYQDIVSYLKKTPIHEMKSSIYKARMNAIRDFLSDLN
jgi:hypothetical protein